MNKTINSLFEKIKSDDIIKILQTGFKRKNALNSIIIKKLSLEVF